VTVIFVISVAVVLSSEIIIEKSPKSNSAADIPTGKVGLKLKQWQWQRRKRTEWREETGGGDGK